MKLGLLGSSGRMGTTVRRLAEAANHEIVASFDLETNPGGSVLRNALEDTDVVIDFTHPDGVLGRITEVARAGRPMVVGTTGWYESLDQVREIVGREGTGLVWGANFSIGALLLLRLTEQAAAFLDRFPEYDPYVLEHHHRGKGDAPSGTAHRLAEKILRSMRRKLRVLEGNPSGEILPDDLQISSIRAGEAFGTHTVGFDAPFEFLEITHSARGREGFALGALHAAEFIRGRVGVYEFPELFEEALP